MAVALNGVILKPSLPAAPIDAFFLYDATTGRNKLQDAAAEVWAAPSFIFDAQGSQYGGHGGLARFWRRATQRPQPVANTFPNVTACPYFSILAVDVPASISFILFPSDLTPSLALCSVASSYISLPWSAGAEALAARCADGAPALGCGVQSFNGSVGLPLATGTPPDGSAKQKGGYHAFEISSLSPLYSTAHGWALIGEVDKFVRVSPVRFSAVMQGTGAAAIVTWVEGAPNETVSVSWLAPGASGGLSDAFIRVVPITFGVFGGTVVVSCNGTGSAAACTQAEH
jgi:hypothetical protein